MIDIVPTVSLLELLWTFICLIAWVYNMAGLADAKEDLKLLKAYEINGFREIIAKGNIRHEQVRIGIQTIFIVVGIMSMFVTNAHYTETASVIRSHVVGAFFIGAAILLTYNSYADRRDRKALIRLRRSNPYLIDTTPFDASDGGEEENP